MPKAAILDTNLLILHISAATDLSLLGRFKRISQFTFEDVLLLKWILQEFPRTITTSYILAEASNLGNSLSGVMRDAWFFQLASYALLTEEQHIATRALGSLPETIRFGITDAALSQLSQSIAIITTERALSGYLRSLDRNVVNFFDVKVTARNLFG